jgi:hypothetical protein
MNNRILTNHDRYIYENLINEMYTLIPEMMSRKIPEANVQQAFMVDTVLKTYTKGDKVLCVGSYEDTAYEYLKIKGIDIIGICPEQNYDLHTFLTKNRNIFYNIIFATSVLEHVEKDEEFIEDMCKLLSPKGIGILTVDFKEGYTSKDKKPTVDFRLYTSKDYIRLSRIIEKYKCFFIDQFRIDASPDFLYEGITYNFATMVFKKVE